MEGGSESPGSSFEESRVNAERRNPVPLLQPGFIGFKVLNLANLFRIYLKPSGRGSK